MACYEAKVYSVAGWNDTMFTCWISRHFSANVGNGWPHGHAVVPAVVHASQLPLPLLVNLTHVSRAIADLTSPAA